MNNLINLESLFHRSKARIKDLGEVFTPEAYVENMLDLLATGRRGFWGDEEIVFFEPCSGHGNIVVSILRRRLDAFYRKALSQGNKEAALYAVANSLNSIWAIDIDTKNIEACRVRVLSLFLSFLKDKLRSSDFDSLLKGDRDFFAHMLAAINWQIFENETLSAISSESTAALQAKMTKPGARWYSQHGHLPLDFSNSWAEYFSARDAAGAIPLEFERASRFIDAINSNRARGFDEYDYARNAIQAINKAADSQAVRKNFSVGA